MRVRLIPAVLCLAILILMTTVQSASGHGGPRAAVALVLRYSFDHDANGSVVDSSPSALHGTLVNADPRTAYTAGMAGRGRAISLIGAQHQYIDVPQSAALDVNRFTIAALVRYTGVQNDSTLDRWEVVEKAGAYWLNIRTNGRVRVGGFFGSCSSSAAWKYLDSANPIPVNTWTRVAGTYNGTTLTVWVNGVRSSSRALSGTTCANDEPLAVGAKNAPALGLLEAFWDGQLDEVRVYNRALSAAEIGRL
jgi:Concanavalin A-like lectin/glucanases superfamily